MSVIFAPSLSLAVTSGSGSGTTVLNAGSYSNTQESQLSWDFSLTASQTNFDLPGAVITKTKMKAFYFLFDTAITLKTNSTGSPQETWTFTANSPWFWDSSHPIVNPFAGDITHFYLTNGAAATAVKIYFLMDAL